MSGRHIKQQMTQTKNSTLYLSKNKKYLTDIAGEIICHRTEKEGKIFYSVITIESEAYKRRCIGLKAIRVCTLWNDNNVCLVWDEVDVCVQWQYELYGFSNIS